MDPQPSLEFLLRGLLLYLVLPAWVLFGFLDYLCHRKARIEHTTGLRECILHIVMGLQISLPILLALVLEINVLVLLVSLGILIFHEVVAHMDVKTAYGNRTISAWEMHAHSFLEVIPFISFGLVAVLKWPVFVKMITFDWAGEFYIAPKVNPISGTFIVGYMVFTLFVGMIPYVEEFLRCYKARPRAAR